MPQKVHIPEPFLDLTENKKFVEVNAATIGGAIEELQSRFPEMTKYLVDENGETRRFAGFYVNDEDIKFLQNRQTPLKDGDQIKIIAPFIDTRPAIAAINVANRLRAGEKI
jgi:molybdopterin synthase sulfur carrier subunit